jgi:BTB/POZ domain
MKSGNEQTVCLDVGGIKYKVSRTLIERYPNTMLGRLVSDTWLKDPTREIFIDRDGDRFRHVLDYMRDGKACLPMSIPKPSMMQELDYFRFENVPSEAFDEGHSNFAAATRMVELQKRHELDVKAGDLEKFYAILAFECFQHYAKTGCLRVLPFLNTNNPTFIVLNATGPPGHAHGSCDAVLFDRHLSKFGLCYVSGGIHDSYYPLELAFL